MPDTDTDSNSDSDTQTYSTHQEARNAAQRLFESNTDVSVTEIKSFDWKPFDVSKTIADTDNPHKQPEILAYLYWIEDQTQAEIADRFGYSTSHISRLMDAIPTGPDPSKHRASVGFYIADDRPKIASHYDGETQLVYSYRLLAVAEYGYDAVVDKQVHHETGCPLDNRIEAITLADPSEHNKLHNSDDTNFVIESKEPRLRNGDADPDAVNAVAEWWGSETTDEDGSSET